MNEIIQCARCEYCGLRTDEDKLAEHITRKHIDKMEVKTKMEQEEETKTPQLGTWDKLPTEETPKLPKVVFDLDKEVAVEFLDEPTELSGDNGAYYIFQVKEDGEEKVIMTSAWTLLRGIKMLSPIKGKKAKITKKLIKGKQQFEVVSLIG